MENSHFRMVPVKPVRVRDPLLDPVQTVSLPATVPPTVAGNTLMVDTAEYAGVHCPFCTMALYLVVVEILTKFWVVTVFVIAVQVTPLSMDDCQLRTFPE